MSPVFTCTTVVPRGIAARSTGEVCSYTGMYPTLHMYSTLGSVACGNLSLIFYPKLSRFAVSSPPPPLLTPIQAPQTPSPLGTKHTLQTGTDSLWYRIVQTFLRTQWHEAAA